MDQAVRGASALASGDFTSAIAHYTDAISTNPQAVDYYIKRSTAYTRISPPNHSSALNDSEIAVVLAVKRGKRELLAQAQLRRAIALFGLERWVDARECFKWVKALNEKEKSLAIWGVKIEGKLKGLEESDERAKVSVKEVPDVEMPIEKVEKKTDKESNQPKQAKSAPESEGAIPPATEDKIEGVQTSASKIRHEWYQTAEDVVITLFAKGIPRDKASIDIQKNSLALSFPLPHRSDFQFHLEPLWAEVDQSASTSKIMSTKVEFVLRKVKPGNKWPSLEGIESLDNGDNTFTNRGAESESVKHAAPSDKSNISGPVYPTSSKSGPKDWDKLANDLTKKPKKSKENGEQGTEDETNEYDESEGDPVNGFFQQLYKGADPDTRRAMMKSYQESNGTALSTNWDEVGKKPTETLPPDGMEAKKW